MLVPAKQIVFEGLSRDYYARQKELASSGFTGCIRLVFADLEGIVVYEAGKPVTALEESGDWMALGSELIAPLENKAAVTDGSMAIYTLSSDMIGFFAGRKIANVVETEAGPMLGTRALIDNLLRDRSVCIFKARETSWIGYAFIAAGKVVDAAFASHQEHLAGDRAVTALKQSAGNAAVIIYFIEGGTPFVEAAPPAEAPSVTVPEPEAPAPAEAMRPTMPEPARADTVIEAPASPEPAIPETEVTIVMASDPTLQPRHPSKLATIETLDDRSVVLVDETTLERLGVKDGGMASVALPGGEVAQVTLLKMDLLSEEGKFAIVPRRLRRRLALVPGAVLTLRQGSALMPLR